ncbi:MAG: hypothetical protein ABL308_04215 [Oceanicaulis sp.]
MSAEAPLRIDFLDRDGVNIADGLLLSRDRIELLAPDGGREAFSRVR